ncbi:MAG: GspMb/PilO family protein [Acidobacteriota bacterium]|jgi:Tfp pilus assembly protein PilO
MTIDIRPWRRLLAIWLPAVLLCVVAAIFYVWQTSESGGRRAQVRNQIEELEGEIARLEKIEAAAESDRQDVEEINRQFDRLYHEVYGDLDERLTRILRAVGSATREAGLLPGTFTYTAKEDQKTGFIRFGIRFGVDAEYPQIRQMLAALQSSAEFLVIEDLNLAGDEDSLSRDLKIQVNIATFLAEADKGRLRQLTGGISAAAETSDG